MLRSDGRVALSIYDGPAGFPFQAELEASIGVARRAVSTGRSFNELVVLRAALSEAGFSIVSEVEMWERFRFSAIGRGRALAAIDRCSSGPRVTRRTPARDAYRAGLAGRLEPLRVATDGPFELAQRAVAVIADVATLTRPRPAVSP